MFEPQKSLGQNFLTDYLAVNQLVNSLELKDGDEVVEIGSGLGVLTEALAQRMGMVPFNLYAIEIDSRFIPKLEGMFSLYRSIRIIEADILEWLPKFEPSTSATSFKILGSLPYYITSPIIHCIVKMPKQPDIATLLVQKEVASKLASSAPDSSYLSVFVQTFFEVSYLETVPSQKFTPSPSVDSAIIVLKRKPMAPLLSIDVLRKYEGFLHKGFGSPRKMLNKRFSQAELATGDVDGTLRAEALTADQWYELFIKLTS